MLGKFEKKVDELKNKIDRKWLDVAAFVVFTAVAPLFIVFALISFFVYMYYEDKIKEAGKEDKKFKATKKYKITKRYKVQSSSEQSEETHATKAK